jgi:hypothetical protein
MIPDFGEISAEACDVSPQRLAFDAEWAATNTSSGARRVFTNAAGAEKPRTMLYCKGHASIWTRAATACQILRRREIRLRRPLPNAGTSVGITSRPDRGGAA